MGLPMGNGGAWVGFRITDRITIFRPCGCVTGILVLLGLPGVWLVLLGIFATARPGFGHWLAEFALTMFSIIVVFFVILVAVLIKPIRESARMRRQLEADRAARNRAAQARREALLRDLPD